MADSMVAMSASLFEGPEKKVELVVTPQTPSLRGFPDERWQRVVKAAGADALSVLKNEQCTAFLLSESSLFVYDDYLVMITCGQTQLVDAVKEILSFVATDNVALLVYERKNENFPQRQPTSFFDDAKELAQLIEGHAVRFGGEHGHCVQMFHSAHPFEPCDGDTTVEVLMHGIDANVARQFSAGRLPDNTTLAEQSGIASLIPNFDIDEYAFSPSGYSLNALDGERYCTIHVTPERWGSYASFETNSDLGGQISSVISGLVELFKPRSFDVVSFVPSGCVDATVEGYTLGDHVVHRLGGYDVTFLQFNRPVTEPRDAYRFDLP